MLYMVYLFLHYNLNIFITTPQDLSKHNTLKYELRNFRKFQDLPKNTNLKDELCNFQYFQDTVTITTQFDGVFHKYIQNITKIKNCTLPDDYKMLYDNFLDTLHFGNINCINL